MDMTYFAVVPPSLRRRKLKVAIVFLHEAFRFEVWLAASNKRVQTHYWKLITENNWMQYRVAPTTRGVDAMLESILTDTPDFRDLPALTADIERGTLTHPSHRPRARSRCVIASLILEINAK
jgi:hypothetical protein